jgi:hypothetical protein
VAGTVRTPEFFNERGFSALFAFGEELIASIHRRDYFVQLPPAVPTSTMCALVGVWSTGICTVQTIL